MVMPEFFEFPPTRSNRAKWALEELGIAYDSRVLDFLNGEHRGPEHRVVHPLGHVPAYRTDRYTMHESVAIVMQLLDEHSDRGMAPAVGAPERAIYYQWCVFASAELDHACWDVMKHTMHFAEEHRVPAIAERGRERVTKRCEALSLALNGRDYLLGDNFTGADICIGYSTHWVAYINMLGAFPKLGGYYARLRERPAFKRVFGSPEG